MDTIKLHPDNIKKAKGGYSAGINDSPTLYYCTKKDALGYVRIISEATQCRESFLSFIRRQQLTTHLGDKVYISGKRPTDKFRFIFANTKNRTDNGSPLPLEQLVVTMALYDARTKQALGVVNTLEDHFGWPRTTVCRVNVGEHLGCNMFMFESSKRWNRSPHLASLLVLILRGARMFELKPYNDIFEAVAQFSKNGVIRKHFQKWYILLEKFDRIFRGYSHHKLYSDQIITKGKSLRVANSWATINGNYSELLSKNRAICSLLYSDGIQVLCEGNSYYDVISQRLETYVRLKKNANKPKGKKAKPKAEVSYA